MLGAIKYNLTHLLDFSGRDARQTFWYYVLFLAVLNFVIGLLVSIPLIVSTIGTAMQAAQSGAGEQAIQAQVMGSMGSTLGSTLWLSLATNAVTALLLVAAFVRRLHDSDKAGWWVLVPLAAQAVSMLVSIRMMGAMQAMMQDAMAAAGDPVRMQSVMEQQTEFARYGAIGWIGPLVVIGFGILRSTDGPNRYGAEPVRF
jgi:uncharacterized membrane protein YhaH (DUF805 family)